MPGRSAARILDPVAHPIPSMLIPGPGSFNVIIGGKPAWRGVTAGAAAAIQAAKATSDATIKAAEAATLAAAGTPAAPAAKAAEEAVKAAAAASMASMIAGAAGGADIHACLTPLPLPPHGPAWWLTARKRFSSTGCRHAARATRSSNRSGHLIKSSWAC
jgi:hypothetical protein